MITLRCGSALERNTMSCMCVKIVNAKQVFQSVHKGICENIHI